MPEYTIGDFSRLTGLSIDTLRYYEKEGLIQAKRLENNRRYYDDTDKNWVDFLLRLKQTGMSIKDMKTYAHLRYQGDSTIAERLVLLEEQLRRLNQQEADIKAHKDFLKQKMKLYRKILTDKYK
ncbi:MerR family transcriptional regulator [Streptococcus dentiloxodontae]